MKLLRLIILPLLLALTVCQPALAADFNKVFHETILPHEGGFTADRRDPGNWTGGKVGKGLLLGTKYGIAANTYGLELLRKGKAIKDLTVEEAGALYKRDFWDANHFGLLQSQGIAEELMDEAVNMGSAGARRLLASVFAEVEWAIRKPLPVGPVFTPLTIAWINEYTRYRPNRIAFYNSLKMKRVAFYTDLARKRPAMRPFLLSWLARTVD